MADTPSTVDQNSSQPTGTGETPLPAETPAPAVQPTEAVKASEPATAPDAAKDAPPDKPAAPAIPEKYELKAPEGEQFNPAFVESISPTLKELGVTAEGAQKLVDGYLAVEAQIRAAQIDSWKAEIAGDSELGGANATRTTANIDRALSWFSKVNAEQAKTLQGALKNSGWGEYPAMVRFINAIGMALADDDTGYEQPIAARSGAAKRSPQDVLYGNS